MEKLKIVHGKVNELFKDIRSDKRLNMHTRKSLSKRSVRSLSMPTVTFVFQNNKSTQPLNYKQQT